jgi:hypothetical protein
MADNELFVDLVGEVAMSGGIVRIDLMAMSVDARGDDDKPVPEFRKRIVMSPNGFLQALQMLENFRDHLIEKGVLVPEETPGPVADVSTGKTTISPNWD